MKYKKSVWLSDKLGIEMSIDTSIGFMKVEWDPRLPTKKQFRAIQSKYQQERDAFISEIARQEGRASTVIVEL
jgi:hypothetical protein